MQNQNLKSKKNLRKHPKTDYIQGTVLNINYQGNAYKMHSETTLHIH